jgi:hypothetical protein
MPIERHRVPHGEGWASLIDTWGYLFDKYEKVSNPDNDVAYWHGENALTASLASAAWQNGGAGLVEFDTKRQCLNPAESGGGRGDAWLRVGDRWYTVEAKLCWSDTVKNCLGDARTQLSMLPKEDRANVGLILCYCVPEFPPDAPQGTFATLAADLERRFEDAELFATYGPVAKMPPRYADKVYPGMVVVGKIVPWGAGSATLT